jgi:putative tricarboxylic transport membrane protein
MVLGMGLALATVWSRFSGRSRFTFGIVPLMQGIDLIPVAMGLFGVAEQAGGLPQISSIRLRELFPDRSEWRREEGLPGHHNPLLHTLH